jgi:hypothetical protein
MHLETFNSLEEKERFDVLFEKGVLLLDRNENGCSYLLYQVNGFYIEVWHELYSDTIGGLSAFMSTELLQPYLELMDIDIKELF